jgi:AcrR family transcriptional regulator
MNTKIPAQYHHGELRQALLAAALEKLDDAEPAAVSLRELAKQIGVSTAAPYNHFKDKEALLNAIADEGFRLLLGRFRQAVEGVPAGRAQIVAIVTAYLRFSRAHPGYYKVMFASAASRAHQASGGQSFADQALHIMLAAIHGAAQVTPERARERAIVLTSLLHGLVSLDRAGPFTKLADAATLDDLAIEAGLRVVTDHAVAQPG